MEQDSAGLMGYLLFYLRTGVYCFCVQWEIIFGGKNVYKVLLVDDEILVRNAISAIIEWNRLGFELVGDCENGKEVIEFVNRHPVDVVLTDICMPYVDGMELSKYLYENNPKISIIIFSGYSDFEYAKKAIQNRVSEYLLKPITAKELSQVLSRIKEKLDQERRQEQRLDAMTKVCHNYMKNESVILSHILSRLVKGTQEVERCLDELEELQVTIPGRSFRVVVVVIDVYSPWHEASEKLKKESAFMSFAVENISNEIIKEKGEGIACHDSDNRVFLLLWSGFDKSSIANARTVCKKIQESVYDTMKLSLSMGIGCCVDSLERLCVSYESAVDILKYRYSQGMGMIFDCSDELRRINPEEFLQRMKDVDSAIKSNDEKSICDTLDQIERWMKEEYVSRGEASAYLQQVLNIVYEHIHETEENFPPQNTTAVMIADAKNIESAVSLTREYAMKGMEALKKSVQSSGRWQALMAMEYIKENYANPDMGLNKICEYLNISTSHFSNILKRETGKTFTEVLTDIRMEKAKQLLRQTDLKNYEIAEKVGFSDPHYFSVAFKKTTGMTPKEYARENV